MHKNFKNIYSCLEEKEAETGDCDMRDIREESLFFLQMLTKPHPPSFAICLPGVNNTRSCALIIPLGLSLISGLRTTKAQPTYDKPSNQSETSLASGRRRDMVRQTS